MQRELVQAPLGPAPAVRELALLGMRMEQLQARQLVPEPAFRHWIASVTRSLASKARMA